MRASRRTLTAYFLYKVFTKIPHLIPDHFLYVRNILKIVYILFITCFTIIKDFHSNHIW
jgi:hypothetical protein